MSLGPLCPNLTKKNPKGSVLNGQLEFLMCHTIYCLSLQFNYSKPNYSHLQMYISIFNRVTHVANLIVSKFDQKIPKGSVPNCQLKFAMHDTMRWFMCELNLPNLVFFNF